MKVNDVSLTATEEVEWEWVESLIPRKPLWSQKITIIIVKIHFFATTSCGITFRIRPFSSSRRADQYKSVNYFYLVLRWFCYN